jgi:hypothetical protein
MKRNEIKQIHGSMRKKYKNMPPTQLQSKCSAFAAELLSGCDISNFVTFSDLPQISSCEIEDGNANQLDKSDFKHVILRVLTDEGNQHSVVLHDHTDKLSIYEDQYGLHVIPTSKLVNMWEAAGSMYATCSEECKK